MLEGENEHPVMDKSNSRQTSVPPRANGSDSKKDGNGSNKRSGGGRWRNSGGRGDIAPKRVQPPTRSHDKRPRSRGVYDRPKQEVTAPEPGSVQKPGSRKQNYNHLLNFSYSNSSDYSYPTAKHASNWSCKRAVRYNKEQFLQANCQFVVREGEDYSIHSADSDTLVEWSLIEQVRLFGDGVPSCPICLCPPVAAKMTRCGHIYCWPCILHYLSLSEKSWAKCPICFEAVHEKHLKSVMTLATPLLSVGDSLSMTLMVRARGSTVAVPAALHNTTEQPPYNVDMDHQLVAFCKLLTAQPHQIQRIVDAERHELQQQLRDDGSDSLEGSFVSAALTTLQKREDELSRRRQQVACDQQLIQGLAAIRMEQESKQTSCKESAQLETKPSVTYASAFSDDEVEVEEAVAVNDASPQESTLRSSEEEEQQPTVCEEEHVEDDMIEEADLALPEPPTGNSKADNFYFYQASDGQPIYLHSVNARCLVHEYKSLQCCPPTISAPVVEVEHTSMTKELRSRLRYLSHVPLTCEFQSVELNLEPPLISPKTLSIFQEDLTNRQRQRQRHKRNEQRELRRMQQVENRKIEQSPSLRASLGGFQNQSFPDMISVIVPSDAPSLQQQCSSSSPVGNSPDSGDNSAQTLSFAQMLRAGRARPPVLPRPASSPALRTQQESGSDTEQQHVPTFQQAFGDAIDAALSKTTDEDGSATAGGRKKKKKVKKLLFTTTMNRAK